LYLQKLKKGLSHLLDHARTRFAAYWRASRWHKTVVILVTLAVFTFSSMYGIAQWYRFQQGGDKWPVLMGATFIPAYAESLGLNAQETMDALVHDVGVRHFRLVSYWDQLEREPGKYDFSLLDWQFDKVDAAGGTVTLGLGLRQPRWPECHMPQWAMEMPQKDWQPRLEQFVQAVVERYKDRESLRSYQLENEYFLRGFGKCEEMVGEKAAFDRERLISEYDLVKKTDGITPVIITRSNNALGYPKGEPRPDEFGISIYKRVWDSARFKRYVEYPFPAWYYAFLAGSQKMLTGRDMIIHELQAEAWPPDGKLITEISLEEQNKSFNAERFKDRIEFGKATGMREMYLWGAEYWYYRKVKLNDLTVWQVARDEYGEARRLNP
jgi:hypothetical protein